MARKLVAVNAQGRVTLPADVRKELHLTEGSQLEVAVDNGRIELTPVQVIPAEDAWAYTPEHRAAIQRALEDVKAGRVFRLSWKELERIVDTGRLPARVQRARTRKSA